MSPKIRRHVHVKDHPNPATALAAAAGSTLMVDPGEWRGTFHIPDRTTVIGNGPESWLRGKVTFGTGVDVRWCKLGDEGFGVTNRNGAHESIFHGTRFCGGGGASQPDQNVLQLGGTAGSCYELDFVGCDVERNSISDAKRDANQRDKQFCDVAIVARLNGADVRDVTFSRGTIGVANGRRDVARDTGSPFASFLCWVSREPGDAVYNGITLEDVTIEVADWTAVDLADYRAGTICGDVALYGCNVKGGHTTTVTIEGPKDVHIADSRLGRGGLYILAASAWQADADASDCLYSIWGNSLDSLTYNGVTDRADRYGSYVHLSGGGNVFTDNIWKGHGHRRALTLSHLHHSEVTNNTFYDYLSVPGESDYDFAMEDCREVTSRNSFYGKTKPTAYTARNTGCTIANTYALMP